MSIVMQALLQCGEVEESIPHFHRALRLLNTSLPSSMPRVLIGITSQIIRQWLHVKFPRRFMGRQRYSADDIVLRLSLVYIAAAI